MSRRVIAVVLTVLLTASTFLMLGQGAAVHPLSPGAARPATDVAPAVTSLSPTTLNGYGSSTDTFYPGAVGSGSIFFAVSDSNTGDKQVNITVTDPNATRDGVSSPAFQLEANLNTTTHTYNSWLANAGYAFPGSIPYGGTWAANFSESATNYVDVPIYVDVYQVNLSDSIGYTAALPGSAITIFWNLTSTANGVSFYTKATNVYITGIYTGNGTSDKLFHPANTALTPTSTGFGMWKGNIPANATPDTLVEVEVYAYTNISGVTVQNESGYLYISVGSLYLRGAGIEAAPGRCTFGDYSPFAVGSTLSVCLQVQADWFGELYDVYGAPVTLNYWNGTAHVTPSGAPTSVATDQYGEAIVTFVADVPPFSQTIHKVVDNGVNLTVSAPGADTHGYTWAIHDNLSFVLNPAPTGGGYVNVTLDKAAYAVGSTATVTWSIHSSDPAKTGPIDPVAWVLYYGRGEQQITALNTTAQSGTFTVLITPAMVDISDPYLYVGVYAANATRSFGWFAEAYVIGPTLFLSTPSYYYTAGSSISVTPVVQGTGTGAIISYQVEAYWQYQFEENLSTGTATNNTPITAAIASTAPPQYIYVYVWLTLDGTVVDSQDLELTLEYGYVVQLGVTTASSYADGSYQPGQTVTLSYALDGIGGAPVPQLVDFAIVTQNFPSVTAGEQIAPTGTISYTIPSNAVRGSLEISLYVDSPLPAPCMPYDNRCEANTTLQINPSPSVLSLELGAGSGVTVGWVIVLVLVLVVGAVLAVMLLRRRAGRGGKSTSPGSSGGSTTSPPPEWKEPGPGGNPPPSSGGSPPNPPTGAA